MQYLLTEEEFKNVVPRSAIEPFTKALADYYRRKNDHLANCLMESHSPTSVDWGMQAAIKVALNRHNREWTVPIPKPEDFIK